MIYGVLFICVLTVALGLLLRRRAEAHSSPSGQSGTTRSGSTLNSKREAIGATDQATSAWISWAGITIGVAFGLPIVIFILFWLLVPGAADWMADRPRMSIGIGVVVSLMILSGLIPNKTMRGIAIFGLVATLLTGIVINIPERAKPSWQGVAKVEAEHWGGRISVNQDMIIMVDTDWSKPYVFPVGKECWWEQETDRGIEARDGRGRIYSDKGISDFSSVNYDPKTKQQIGSRVEEPDRTWQFRFTSGEPGRVKVYCRPYNG